MTPEQKGALERLVALGQQLSKGTSWKVRLATRWGADPETGEPCIVEDMVLDTGDLKALAGLDSSELEDLRAKTMCCK